MKYVAVTGGVVSGLGKGITSSSIGVLLKAAGLNVTSIKIDPYLNSDAGTMSPYEHGEVYVLDDGGEADLDLGNYERFLETRLSKDHNITTGKVYAQVIARERKGDYLGKTVQVIPHITDAIQHWIERVAKVPVDPSRPGIEPDVCLIEFGGTVGDIESMIFLEALRQMRYRFGGENVCHVHVSLVPVVGAPPGEAKSKPTQHGVKELRAVGLSPDIIIARSTQPLNRSVISKISQFCMVPYSHVISVHDVSNIYRVPLLLLEQRVASLIMSSLRLTKMPPEDLPQWREMGDRLEHPSKGTVRIAIVGKYTGLSDSYLSVTKSLSHAAITRDVKVDIVWIDSSQLEPAVKEKHPDQYAAAWEDLKSVQGILVPGGFGDRGVEGKVLAIKYAREEKVPFFGICLGFQIAVIEYARSICGIENATSGEFDPDAEDPVIIYMPEISREHLGGTMRLGSRKSVLTEKSLALQIYSGERSISERHRHRYEVNPEYVTLLQEHGLQFSGVDAEEGVRMECCELKDKNAHPFFFACQYHPEFLSKPLKPSPPFLAFVTASMGSFKFREMCYAVDGASGSGNGRSSGRGSRSNSPYLHGSPTSSSSTGPGHSPTASPSPSASSSTREGMMSSPTNYPFPPIGSPHAAQSQASPRAASSPVALTSNPNPTSTTTTPMRQATTQTQSPDLAMIGADAADKKGM